MDHLDSTDQQAPLLSDTVDGAVDYKGQPVLRSSSGGWRSAFFMIGVDVAEGFAYYGISSNLITYLTGPLGQSVAAAAEMVNVWSGMSLLLTLLGAFVADSFLGRYRTIFVASVIYVSGLSLLTLSTLLPTTKSSICKNSNKLTSCSTPKLQFILFLVSLYLVGIGEGGYKPCMQAFGADQFDGKDPGERKSKTSFFNWRFFGVCFGTLVTIFVVTYIQENLSWSLGFGIPCVAMLISLIIFVLGTKSYRYSIKQSDKSPFVRIGRVYVAAVRNWRTSASAITFEEEEGGKDLSHQNSGQFKFLNKACLVPHDSNQDIMVCSIHEVEDAKTILRIVPIWISAIIFAIVFAQDNTFFTKQGATLDRSILHGFVIPAASLESFIFISILTFISVYDLVFVPIARAFTGNPSGITTLQRVGTGMVISTISMVVASLIEKRRLKTAVEHGLVDRPDITLPMSFWWLVPQYVLNGLADVFTLIGLQEFFYDQVPKDLKSMGPALFSSVLGVGSILSSLLISAIDEATKANGHHGWFSNNLNKAHLDYFYLLLAGLSILGFIAFLYVAKLHTYVR